jgi:DnaB-like helicase N terminal domain
VAAHAVEVLFSAGWPAIYQVILDLHGDGKPTDPVAVLAELERRRVVSWAGGASYLHTLIATTPTAAFAGLYAGIVADKARRRRRTGRPGGGGVRSTNSEQRRSGTLGGRLACVTGEAAAAGGVVVAVRRDGAGVWRMSVREGWVGDEVARLCRSFRTQAVGSPAVSEDQYSRRLVI